MSRFIILKVLFCLLMYSSATLAQSKIGWLSTQAVMDKLLEAQEAQRQLDVLVTEWQNELAKMQNDWQRKFQEYDKKKLIYTDKDRIEKEKELQELDKKIADYRNRKFGQNGELFQKQNELMKPVQDKIFKAIQEIAKDEGYDYVFDKSGEISLMYTNEKFDITQQVIEKVKTYKR